MTRKLAKVAALFVLLMCLMGADTIDWNAGQPIPNPGGKASMMEGAGTYGVDPAHFFVRIDFQRQVPGTFVINGKQANTNAGKWDATDTCGSGNFDTWGEMVTTNNKMQFFVTKTTKSNITVK